MTDSDEARLLAYLHDRGGAVVASANLDPQWNEATAETKHDQDLRHELAEDAGLERSTAEVVDLLEDLVGRGLVSRSVTSERARLELTEAGAEACSARD